jgi:hypothetical protein
MTWPTFGKYQCAHIQTQSLCMWICTLCCVCVYGKGTNYKISQVMQVPNSQWLPSANPSHFATCSSCSKSARDRAIGRESRSRKPQVTDFSALWHLYLQIHTVELLCLLLILLRLIFHYSTVVELTTSRMLDTNVPSTCDLSTDLLRWAQNLLYPEKAEAKTGPYRAT